MSRDPEEELQHRFTATLFDTIEQLDRYSRIPGFHTIEPSEITCRLFFRQESLWQWERNEHIEMVARQWCQTCSNTLMLTLLCQLCKLLFARSSQELEEGNLLCARCYEDSPHAFA